MAYHVSISGFKSRALGSLPFAGFSDLSSALILEQLPPIHISFHAIVRARYNEVVGARVLALVEFEGAGSPSGEQQI